MLSNALASRFARTCSPGQPRRPTHTTDIHTLDSDGHEVWIDVKVTAVLLGRLVGLALREAERTKRAGYGLPPCPTMIVYDGAYAPGLFGLN